MPSPRFGAIRGYAAALAAVLAAYGVTSLTWPLFQPTPMVLFYAGVIAATRLGGVRPGAFAVALSAVVGYIAFLPPYGAFGTEPKQLGTFAAFLAVASTFVWLIGDRQRAAAREAEQRRWFAATLASVGDAAIATDTEGRVTFLNDVAERLTGWTIREAKGRPLEEVFAIFKEGTTERSESPVRRALETGRIVGLSNHTVLVAKDGRETPIKDSAAPIRDDEGAVRGVIMVFRDATELRSAELAAEAVYASEQRFRALVTATSDVVYRMSPDWSEMRQLVGRQFIADTTEPDRSWPEKYIHLDDRPHVFEVIGEAVRTKSIFELEHRVVRVDGSLGWTFSRAVPILDPDGNVIEWFGTASDVTRRKEAEEALVRSEQHAKQSLELLYYLVEQCPFGMYIVDEDFRIATMNRGSQEGAFANVRPVIGRPFDEAMRILWPEPVAADIIREFRRTLDTGEPYSSKDFVNPRADTDRVEGYEWELHRVTLPDGRPGVACYFFDATELRAAEAALRESDRRKDEFLAMLAHELRNPLAAISNAVNLTAQSTLQEHIEWAMGVITRQMRHLTHLIDDLLDVSRISRGKIELRRTVVELTPILEGAAATVRPLVEERKHTLELSADRGDLWSDVDPTRLEQVVVNLLSNAAKYSDNGGSIRLSARSEGEKVVIAVKDRGHGIPPEKLPQMFELFAQGDRSLARSEGGLGIGLTVVKKLVEMHGGTVEVRSEGSGMGSQFLVRLPRAARPASAASGAVSPAPAAEKRCARILVVDDNVDTARSLAKLLELLGHEVRVAYNGPEGIEAARRLEPEFILLDIGLPGMDGYEVARRLKQEPGCRATVIIAVSGYGQDEDRRRSREAGFDHHLVKPVDFDQLVSLMSPVC
jgi:PAS domain S-box-containing protein